MKPAQHGKSGFPGGSGEIPTQPIGSPMRTDLAPARDTRYGMRRCKWLKSLHCLRHHGCDGFFGKFIGSCADRPNSDRYLSTSLNPLHPLQINQSKDLQRLRLPRVSRVVMEAQP
jgi:hypothetical protein